MALSKTGIEYLTHVWNFYVGCNHWKTGVCPVGEKCWAKGMSKRFSGGNFEPHLLPEKLLDPLKGKQGGRRIGVCFTGDLFGEWVDWYQWVRVDEVGLKFEKDENGDELIAMGLRDWVFDTVRKCPQDTFVFLTKNPAGLLKWGKFPDNYWVGVSVCNQPMFTVATDYLSMVEAKVKFISFEPVMNSMGCFDTIWQELYLGGISWAVIGGWSTGKARPKIEWIKEIVDASDSTGIPVFLKDNLTGKCNKAGLPVDGLLERHNAPWAFRDKGANGICYRREYPREG